MTWKRVTCPACGRDVAVSPRGDIAYHDASPMMGMCQASYSTVEDARVGALDSAVLEAAVRSALLGADPRDREAFEDLLAKHERDLRELQEWSHY